MKTTVIKVYLYDVLPKMYFVLICSRILIQAITAHTVDSSMLRAVSVSVGTLFIKYLHHVL